VISISMDKNFIGPWIAKRINMDWYPQGRETIGLYREEDKEILAGVLFEDYTGACVSTHISIANPNVPIRKLLVTCAMYAFDQLGCKKVLGLVPSNNTEALNFDIKIGFKPEAIIKDVFNDADMLVLYMTREECSFLPKRKAA